ncbi:type II toxin-antitoxin system RelE/ParE family toxin [Epilithonimonas xixisoli]|uniref:Plasmid stabilization system protein ParE n=1 Tax=Epilithonimonas xixisoli TaxID=1476462 RepID=A0A4R8IBS1_9FLAO|nr:type II toxin-antitoxin system RelE/ParE family toxin [Epilithonimonas xixisoli]TDX87164.1 plasmid stabilization system protein ParE [Epilithonimonas xixisoli]
MNYKIVFLKPASQELEDSFSWYEEKKNGLGHEFIEEIEYYLNLIENNPLLFEKHEDKADLRRIPLIRFPFLIIYWIAEQEKIIYIDAVFHSKRKPKF